MDLLGIVLSLSGHPVVLACDTVTRPGWLCQKVAGTHRS